MFQKEGFLEHYDTSNASSFEGDYQAAKLRLIEDKQALEEKKARIEKMRVKLNELDTDLLFIEASIKIDESLLHSSKQALDFKLQLLNKLCSELSELEVSESTLGRTDELRTLRKQVEMKETAHFQRFCEEAGVENIKEFLRKVEESSLIPSQVKQLEDEIKEWEKESFLESAVTTEQHETSSVKSSTK